jgi:hypothetical protein
MAFSHGSKAAIYANGYVLSPWVQSVSSSGLADQADSSTLGNTSKTYIPGLTDATLTTEGLFDGVALAIDDQLKNILGSATKSNLSYFPASETFGLPAYGMSADMASWDSAAATDAIVSLNTEFQSSVGLERCLCYKVLGQVSGNGNGTSIDYGATSTLFGGVAYLQATQSSGATLTVKIQDSADNSAWADILTFAGVTALGSQRVAITGTVRRYTRALWTISAGTGTFNVIFGRKVQ